MITIPDRLQKLDELLVVLDRCSPPAEAEFAHEHIQEARTYLLGAMPREYESILELTRQTLGRMADTEERQRAEDLLAGLSMH